MTARQAWTLVCDRAGGDGCKEHDRPSFTIGAKRAGETRVAAAAIGWTSETMTREVASGPAPLLDWCPACSRKLHRERILAGR